MTRLLALLSLVFCLLAPLRAYGESLTVKDPLNYPLKQYLFVLAMALLGGAVGWYSKVRKGQLKAGNLAALVGELCTSAFSGLLAFYACEYFSLAQVLTAAVVGIAGHMGTRAITWAEDAIQRKARVVIGYEEDKP